MRFFCVFKQCKKKEKNDFQWQLKNKWSTFQEYDHPHVLLEDKDSAFTSMVKETGSAMHDQLARVAKKAYMDKYENRWVAN